MTPSPRVVQVVPMPQRTSVRPSLMRWVALLATVALGVEASGQPSTRPPEDVLAANVDRTVSRSRYYTGVTSDLSARLEAHNSGRCAHTSPNAPWEVDVFVQFADERRAVAFERYLKSGSGYAFAKRHLR
jgi:putative endonuclease